MALDFTVRTIKMGNEKNSKYYDEFYQRENSSYNLPYSQSGYYNLWAELANHIQETDSIVDLGCGVGQFASLLHFLGLKKYIGLDFSEVAIGKAKSKNLDGYEFKISDITKDDFPKGDVYVLCEVLEHVQNDFIVLGKIPDSKKVLISLPTFDCESHVRYFPTQHDVIARYDDQLKDYSIKLLNGRHFCFVGYKMG